MRGKLGFENGEFSLLLSQGLTLLPQFTCKLNGQRLQSTLVQSIEIGESVRRYAMSMP